MILAGTAEDLPRAHGAPRCAGRIRLRAADFRVVEELGFEAAGHGPHRLLEVEKTALNTADVATMLARYAGVARREVGYSGLKDRHAVTTQWFSVPHSAELDWSRFAQPGVRILADRRHHRKLKRGAHVANRFQIQVALDQVDAGELDARLDAIRRAGVPNYFGEQRFGRRFNDNVRCLLAGGRLPRMQRGMTLSGVRAALFNQVLGPRVADGSWCRALPGEYLNLDGTRSGFAAPDDDPDIVRRIAALDLHPTAPLYGGGDNPATGVALRREAAVLDANPAGCALLVAAGLKLERRPLRLVVRELEWRLDEGAGRLQLGFALRRGQFATSVLREILDYRDVSRAPDGMASALRRGAAP